MNKARGYARSSGRGLLPRSLAVLGEVGPLAIYVEPEHRYYEIPWRAGRVLATTPDGRELFILRPSGDAGPPRRIGHQALEAQRLHERFVHREGNGFYNCIVPHFSAPRYRGDLAILHYYVDKDMPADEDEDVDETLPTEWVHYFEEPNRRPAFPPLFFMGHGQYYIPPGEFAVTDEGIVWAEPPRKTQRRTA